MRKGIYCAGNWIIDDIKIIDQYPHQDGLTNIRGIKSNNGGAPYNVLKDLARLGAPFPLYGAGLVGNDEKGEHILNDIGSHGVDISNLKTTNEAPTSYTDVMTVASTGRRTFFHDRGANALFGKKHLNLDINARIFHMAYLLLLDQMDEVDESERSVASYVFEEAQKKGFQTSSDIVSEASDRFLKVVPSALPFINYLFVNEYEASRLTDIEIEEEGRIMPENAYAAVEKIIGMGVNDLVILHFPGGSITCNTNHEKTAYPSLKIPDELIRGTAGAGDAFAAGVLLGLHENWSLNECLRLGTCAAGASLFDESCSDGVKTIEEVLKLESRFGLRKAE